MPAKYYSVKIRPDNKFYNELVDLRKKELQFANEAVQELTKILNQRKLTNILPEQSQKLLEIIEQFQQEITLFQERKKNRIAISGSASFYDDYINGVRFCCTMFTLDDLHSTYTNNEDRGWSSQGYPKQLNDYLNHHDKLIQKESFIWKNTPENYNRLFSNICSSIAFLMLLGVGISVLCSISLLHSAMAILLVLTSVLMFGGFIGISIFALSEQLSNDVDLILEDFPELKIVDEGVVLPDKCGENEKNDNNIQLICMRSP